MRSTEQLLTEIDATLSQLIQNAEAMKRINSLNFFEEEVIALQKTQESLLAKLLHIQQAAINSTNNDEGEEVIEIQKKMMLFNKLNTSMMKRVVSKFCSRNPDHKRKSLILLRKRRIKKL